MSSERCNSWFRAFLCCALIACGGGSSNGTGDDAPGDGPGTGPGDGPGTPHDGGPGDGSAAPGDGPSGVACDFIHQTGCGANQKCDLDANGRFACVANGTLKDFQACDDTRPNACAAGFTCSSTFFDAHRCTRMCSQLENQCRSNEPCEKEHNTVDGKQFLTCVTHEECNPIADDCIPAGTHCSYQLVISACLTPGVRPDGATCQLHSDNTQECLAGSACVTVARNTLECVKLCDPAGGAPTCAAGMACVAFTKVGPQDVGMCRPAP